MSSDICVIVSFYDERPSDELFRLLRQLRDIEAGTAFELRVVVNSPQGRQLQLPSDLAATHVTTRENTGFNIGAWNHGWKQNPGFSFYVFLQDECEIVRKNWLLKYKQLLSRDSIGLVGESLIYWRSWSVFRSRGAEVHRECVSVAQRNGIELGRTPTHIQTLVLGATAACLSSTGGFLLADGKAEAIATEVVFSRLCIQRGFKIVQSAWRPFEFIRHSQWDFLRNDSTGLVWNTYRLIKSVMPY